MYSQRFIIFCLDHSAIEEISNPLWSGSCGHIGSPHRLCSLRAERSGFALADTFGVSGQTTSGGLLLSALARACIHHVGVDGAAIVWLLTPLLPVDRTYIPCRLHPRTWNALSITYNFPPVDFLDQPGPLMTLHQPLVLEWESRDCNIRNTDHLQP